jgi:hypothetical protein
MELGTVLVCCGALIAGPAVAGSNGHRGTDAQNHQAAARDAAALLNRVRLPSGATPSSREPTGDGGVLAAPPFIEGVEKLVHQHAWWTVHEPPDQVFSYIESHPPRGGTTNMTCSGGGNQPSWSCVGFAFPARAGVLGIRELAVKVVGLRNGNTGIRVDTEVQWLINRPVSEKVPSGVGEIEVTRSGPSRGEAVAVGDPATVHRIIRLFDALPVLQPGVWHCPAIRSNAAIDSFSFRPAGGGRALARASVRADVGSGQTGCDAMSVSIGGRPQMPLVGSRHFLLAVGHLLRFRLTQRPR